MTSSILAAVVTGIEDGGSVPVTLDISCPAELRPVFGPQQRLAVRETADGRARRALLLWLWIEAGGQGAWVGTEPEQARAELEAMIAVSPKAMRRPVPQFFASTEQARGTYAAVVVEQQPGEDFGSWTRKHATGRVRVLEALPAAAGPSLLAQGFTVDALRDMLQRARAGEDVGYDEFELGAALTTASFYDFVVEYWHAVVPEEFSDNWHIHFLCNELQCAAERVFRNEPKEYDLLINISPGSTKSLLVSVFFPAWVWKRMPSARYIGASYGHNLAVDLSRKCRDVVTSPRFAEETGLSMRDDQDSKGYFVNTRGGMRMAVGTGGIAGFHAHFVGIDDPLDPNAVLSEAEVKACNSWVDNLLQRKVNQTVSLVILVMQRLRQNDPAGVMLERVKLGERVRHVCLPAELTPWVSPPECAQFYSADGLMDPRRLPWDVLKSKKLQGDFKYSGQYLQRPVPVGGSKFKVERITKVPADQAPKATDWAKPVVRYWDKGGTAGGGCFTVGAKMGIDRRGRVWILHCKRGQWDDAAREDVIEEVAVSDCSNGAQVRQWVEQEPGSGGKQSADMTVRRLSLKGVTCLKDLPKGAKPTRWDPLATAVNSGIVYMIEGNWNTVLLDELEFVPNSTYKDQVDALSGAYAVLTDGAKEVSAFLR